MSISIGLLKSMISPFAAAKDFIAWVFNQVASGSSSAGSDFGGRESQSFRIGKLLANASLSR